MKKTIGTMMVAGMVVLLTGTFALAEYAVAGVGNFPYFQLGCLIIGRDDDHFPEDTSMKGCTREKSPVPSPSTRS